MSLWIRLMFMSIQALCLIYFFIVAKFLPPNPKAPERPIFHRPSSNPQQECNLFTGKWVQDLSYRPLYGADCPFHRSEWNCLKNKRTNMTLLNSWRWVPANCSLPQIHPHLFLRVMRNRSIGFIGDSVSENFMVSLACILHTADGRARNWKRGVWRGAYFPKFNVTVAYLRATSLATYEYDKLVSTIEKPLVRMDVNLSAWFNAAKFYDVLVFNSEHRWKHKLMPTDTPLIIGELQHPPYNYTLPHYLVFTAGTVSYIRRGVRRGTLNFWHTQSPIHYHSDPEHFFGGCLFSKPLNTSELDSWMFDESYWLSREVSSLVEKGLAFWTRGIKLLDLTHLSEFRVDAHPAAWWRKLYYEPPNFRGQDCIHWCLPGLPDIWVDILSDLIMRHFRDHRR